MKKYIVLSLFVILQTNLCLRGTESVKHKYIATIASDDIESGPAVYPQMSQNLRYVVTKIEPARASQNSIERSKKPGCNRMLCSLVGTFCGAFVAGSAIGALTYHFLTSGCQLDLFEM